MSSRNAAATPSSGPPSGEVPAVTIVIPTRNEEAAVPALLDRLDDVLGALGGASEVVFVDDSDDGTVAAVDRGGVGRCFAVRLVHRPIGDRHAGLGGALVRGFESAAGDVLAVMDADLQHPPELLPALLAPLLAGQCDITVGSRYLDGASGVGLASRYRRATSVGSRAVVHALFPRTRSLTDPGGNFFAFRRSVVEGVVLRPNGYKMLAEVLVRGRWVVAEEVPYTFGLRQAGESSSTMREGLRFARHMGRLRFSAPATVVGAAPVAAVPVAAVAATTEASAPEIVIDLRDRPAAHRGSPLAVLLVASEVPPVTSGVARSLGSLADGLRSLGHDVDLLSTADFRRLLLGEVRLSAMALSWPTISRRLDRYDVVNLHGPAPTFSDLFMALHRAGGTRPPLVYTHHFEIDVGAAAWAADAYNAVTRRLAHRADRIVVSTPSYAGLMADPLSPTPVDLVPWGIDVERYLGPPRAERPRDSVLRVLFVGQMRAYKGVEILLAAAAGGGIEVTVAGGGASLERYRAVGARLAPHVRFLGRVPDDDLSALYAGHDVIVLPSISKLEAFGLVLLEGMAAGCVPVASDLPGVCDVAGPTGVLVPPGDARRLRDALVGLAGDPKRLHRLSLASQARVLGLDATATVAGLEAVLRGAVAGRPARRLVGAGVGVRHAG